jgi:hypothetical protein
MKVIDRNDSSFKPVNILVCAGLVILLHTVIQLFIVYIRSTLDVRNPFYVNLFQRNYGLSVFELFIVIAVIVSAWVGVWLAAQCVCDRKCCKVAVLGIMLFISLCSTVYAWQAKNTLIRTVEARQQTYEQTADTRAARPLLQPAVVQSNKNSLATNRRA